MNKIKTRSFIVDVAKTMVDTNIVNGDIPDNQRLYCKCGGISNFNQKIKRNIISKHNTTVEDKTSVKSIKCPIHQPENNPTKQSDQSLYFQIIFYIDFLPHSSNSDHSSSHTIYYKYKSSSASASHHPSL